MPAAYCHAFLPQWTHRHSRIASLNELTLLEVAVVMVFEQSNRKLNNTTRIPSLFIFALRQSPCVTLAGLELTV